MFDLLHCLTNLLFFDVRLYLCIYINSSSAIVFCLFYGDKYRSVNISIDFSSIGEMVSGALRDTVPVIYLLIYYKASHQLFLLFFHFLFFEVVLSAPAVTLVVHIAANYLARSSFLGCTYHLDLLLYL